MIFMHRNAAALSRFSDVYSSKDGELSNVLGGRNIIIEIAHNLGDVKSVISLMPSKVDASVLLVKPAPYFIDNLTLFVVDLYAELKPSIQDAYKDIFTGAVVTDGASKKVFSSVFENIAEAKHECLIDDVGKEPITELLKNPELCSVCGLPRYFNGGKITFSEACGVCCGKVFKRLVDEDRFFIASIAPLFLWMDYADLMRSLQLRSICSSLAIPHMLAYYARESLFDEAIENKMYDLAEAIAFRYIGSMPRRCIDELKGRSNHYGFLSYFHDYLNSEPTTIATTA